MSFSNARKMEGVCRRRFGIWCFTADLSKAFACLGQELLIIAKLDLYEFSWVALKLICGYLWNRKPRIKINISHS